MNNVNIRYLLGTIFFSLVVIFVAPNSVSAERAFYSSTNDCNNSTSSYENFRCLTYFAHQNKDIGVCLNKYDEENTLMCLKTYAIWEKDADICNTLDQYIKSANSPNQYYKERCFYDLALATRNDNLCSTVSNSVDWKGEDECKHAVKKLQSYYFYIPILIVLFLVSLIFLFFLKKNTKIRLLIATLVSLVPPILIILITKFIEFLKDWDFFFQFNKSAPYLSTLQKYLSDFSFVYIFEILIFVYLPIATLINTYQIYKHNNPKWWQFLLIFFAIHIFGIIGITLATAGYGLFLALPLSGVSALITLVVFFTFVFIHKRNQQV